MIFRFFRWPWGGRRRCPNHWYSLGKPWFRARARLFLESVRAIFGGNYVMFGVFRWELGAVLVSLGGNWVKFWCLGGN